LNSAKEFVKKNVWAIPIFEKRASTHGGNEKHKQIEKNKIQCRQGKKKTVYY